MAHHPKVIERIRVLRSEGKTQREIATELGISQAAVWYAIKKSGLRARTVRCENWDADYTPCGCNRPGGLGSRCRAAHSLNGVTRIEADGPYEVGREHVWRMRCLECGMRFDIIVSGETPHAIGGLTPEYEWRMEVTS